MAINRPHIVKRRPTYSEGKEQRWWKRGDVSTMDSLLDSLIAHIESAWEDDSNSRFSYNEQDESAPCSEVIRSPAELEFESQKQAFESIPPSELERYRGQFVAVLDGVIVDSDNDLQVLDQRFIEQYGDVPVYMTKVGEVAVVNMPSPFLR